MLRKLTQSFYLYIVLKIYIMLLTDIKTSNSIISFKNKNNTLVAEYTKYKILKCFGI